MSNSNEADGKRVSAAYETMRAAIAKSGRVNPSADELRGRGLTAPVSIPGDARGDRLDHAAVITWVSDDVERASCRVVVPRDGGQVYAQSYSREHGAWLLDDSFTEDQVNRIIRRALVALTEPRAAVALGVLRDDEL